MLYELIAAVRPGHLAEVKELARAAGSVVLTQRGVIRSLSNWGVYLLPKPVSKNQIRYATAHHFVMRFDCAPSTQEAVKNMLGLDPRMLKFGVVKMGDGKLESSAEVGQITWTRKSPDEQRDGLSY